MDVQIYHPELDTTIDVAEESVPHLRRSGWLLASEHEAGRISGGVPADQAPRGWVPATSATDSGKGKRAAGKAQDAPDTTGSAGEEK